MFLITTTILDTMYVCICQAVTDRDIHEAVREGACCMDCLAERLAVSTCCGQCSPSVSACLESSLAALNDEPLAVAAG